MKGDAAPWSVSSQTIYVLLNNKNHTFLEGGFEKPLKGAVNNLIKNLSFIKT